MTRRTVLKAPFVMEQDITKSEGVWHPSEVPADGDVPMLDGSDTMLATYWWGNGVLPTYQTRDDRRVISIGGNYTPMGISPNGISKGAWHFGSYVLFTAYLDLVDVYSHIQEPTQSMYGGVFVDFTNPVAPAAGERWSRSMDEDTGLRIFGNAVSVDTTGWVPGWYRFGTLLHSDRSFSVHAGPESSEIEWLKASVENYYPNFARDNLLPSITPDCTQDPNAIFDLYEIAWGLE